MCGAPGRPRTDPNQTLAGGPEPLLMRPAGAVRALYACMHSLGCRILFQLLDSLAVTQTATARQA